MQLYFLTFNNAMYFRCVGTCSNNVNWKPGDIPPPGQAQTRPSNLLKYFYSDNDDTHKPGLWSCWNACNSTAKCTHYTLSRVTETDSRFYHNQKAGAPDVNICLLWTNCDKFTIPAGTTDYFGKGSNTIGRRNLIISDHWSGAKDCDDWKEFGSCPLLKGRSYKVGCESERLNITYLPYSGKITLEEEKQEKEQEKGFWPVHISCEPH